MKKSHRFLLTLIPVIAVPAYLVLYEADPGELARVHFDLRGEAHCADCHSPDGLSAGCLACHEEIAVQLQEKRGFHYSLDKKGEQKCAKCHSDHRGSTFEPVNVSSWPGRDLLLFTHADMGFTLNEGKHGEIATKCADCHNPKSVNALPAIHKDLIRCKRTFLGLDETCKRCHENPHRKVVSDSCEECHEQADWKEISRFDHEKVFSLAGEHKEVRCDQCHKPHATDPIGEVVGKTCSACHTDPHAEFPLQASFTLAAGVKEEACTGCHGEGEQGFAADVPRYERSAHAPDRFPLLGRHVEISCRGCHRRPEDVSAPAGLMLPAALEGISSAECTACHIDVHADPRTETLHFETQGACATCHDNKKWGDGKFTREAHETTGFPLTGVHGKAECASCHKVDDALVRSRGKSKKVRACAACHETPHTQAISSDCSECHASGESSWLEATLTVSQHASTRFPLTAPHNRQKCAECHDPREKRYAERHRKIAAKDCQSCHTDPHRGQFKDTSCSTCHEKSFLPSTFTAVRHDVIGFALEGDHAATRCSACHVRRKSRSKPDVVWRRFRGTPKSCRSCHKTPHGPEFNDLISKSDCTACHSGTAHWDVPSFDHQATRFELTGAHKKVGCAECHPKRSGATPGKRLRPLSLGCAGCHSDPHAGQFLIDTSNDRRAGDCVRCHDADSASWQTPAFDHAETRFPLDGAHESLSCSGCHRAYHLKDGRDVVRYRPLGTDCKDCHGSFEND